MTSIGLSDLSQVSIDQLLGALEKKLENVNHLANTEAITTFNVDCYEARARAILSRLNSLRNALRPVHKLPDELLLCIFRLIQPPLHTFPVPYVFSSEHEELRWLSVTKVCRYWRQLALGSPSLWRTMTFPEMPLQNSHEFQYWFFKNSSPMTIHLFHYNFADFFPPLTQRLETLDLLMSDDVEDSWDFLGRPIDSLATLSLSRDDLLGRLRAVPQILGGRPSNVKKLYLESVWCWPQNNQTFRNVSHLVLRIFVIPVADILDMMNACPSLKALQLEQVIAWLNTPPRKPSSSFPRLDFLISKSEPYSYPTSRRSIGIHSMIFSPTAQIYASGPLLDLNHLVEELRPELRQPVTLLDIYFKNVGSSFLLEGAIARFSLDVREIVVDIIKVLFDYYLAKHFPETKEINFAFSDDILKNPESLKSLQLTEFFSCLPNLSTLRFMTRANYLPFVDALAKSSISIDEVFVKEFELDLEDEMQPELSQVEWARIREYQEAGVTLIHHSQGTSSYRLVVEPLGMSKYQPICIPEVRL